MSVKEGLSSLDLFVLVREFGSLLERGKVDKIFQIGGRELKIRFHVSGTGKKELVVAPNFICLTSFERPAPESPTSFAMQLRKHLNGAYFRGVRQVEFDRILEFEFEGGEGRKSLVAEFFHHGNVFLLSEDRKILGLLEWQKWKDRVLGVGKTYEYPPSRTNPMTLERNDVEEGLKKSDKSVVRTLANELGWPGLAAEEICAMVGIKKDSRFGELKNDEKSNLIETVFIFKEKLLSKESSPQIVFDEKEEFVEVLPFDFKIFEGQKKKSFDSFNDAVDEYFGGRKTQVIEGEGKIRYQKELAKLEKMRSSQEALVSDLEKKGGEYQIAGDNIYQHLTEIEEIKKAIETARKKGLSDKEILEKFAYGRKKGIKSAKLVKDLKKEKLTVEI
ncbi:MAG: NFACT family protein [Candidatus Altiarchaeota archaeon]